MGTLLRRMSSEMNILGLMSGTSLDGLDMALCHFDSEQRFQLLAAATIPYPEHWRQRLAVLHRATALEYVRADVELGHWMGMRVREFLSDRGLHADCIASHGHTVFHQPQQGLTTQIGDPNAISAETGLAVVADFRRLDVALGGQGAPLVPIGDRMLFADYGCCINLGGIANISYEADDKRLAYDICPCNMALNLLAARQGQPYDRDGAMASAGRIDQQLLQTLEALDYYRLAPPKTLGKEWFEQHMEPLFRAAMPTADLMRTVAEHIARQLAAAIPKSCSSALVTGGGAHNTFLIGLLRQKRADVVITVPEAQIIDYKEAIIFSLLGYLRLQGQPNCLASVTGARRDSSAGLLCGDVNL